MADEKPAQPNPGIQAVRATDFVEKYANNVSFESSTWDLKAFFGTLDQGTPDSKVYPSSVNYHTSVAMPWRQAKLMAYGACMNVLWHEQSNGKIPSGSPPSLEKLAPSIANTPEGKRLIELDALLRLVLFDEQSEAK